MGYNSHNGGAVLRERRLSMGYTIQQLTDRSRETFGEAEGLNVGSISRVETGRYDKPAFEDIAKMAYLLQVDLAQVAEWYGLPAYGRLPEPAEHDVLKRIKAAVRGVSQVDEMKLYERLIATLGYWRDEMEQRKRSQRARRQSVPSEPMQEIGQHAT